MDLLFGAWCSSIEEHYHKVQQKGIGWWWGRCYFYFIALPRQDDQYFNSLHTLGIYLTGRYSLVRSQSALQQMILCKTKQPFINLQGQWLLIFICYILRSKLQLMHWWNSTGPMRCLQILSMSALILSVEVQAFFLKFILWIPPRNPLNTFRLVIWFGECHNSLIWPQWCLECFARIKYLSCVASCSLNHRRKLSSICSLIPCVPDFDLSVGTTCNTRVLWLHWEVLDWCIQT